MGLCYISVTVSFRLCRSGIAGGREHYLREPFGISTAQRQSVLVGVMTLAETLSLGLLNPQRMEFQN